MTVPVGKDKNGLPIGMQLIGNAFEEKTLIRAAYTYECATGKQYETMADISRASAGGISDGGMGAADAAMDKEVR